MTTRTISSGLLVSATVAAARGQCAAFGTTNRRTKSLLVLMAICASVLVGGCTTSRSRNTVVDSNWNRFIEVAAQLDSYCEQDGGKTYRSALEVMGLTDQFGIHGRVLVASGDRTRVSVHPTPHVCESGDQLLLASGNIGGGAGPEFIFAAGWFGPMAGLLAVYDQDLHLLSRTDTGSIWRVKVARDSLGRPCIICHEDEHPGTGMFMRFIRVYRYVPGVGLVREQEKREAAYPSTGTGGGSELLLLAAHPRCSAE